MASHPSPTQTAHAVARASPHHLEVNLLPWSRSVGNPSPLVLEAPVTALEPSFLDLEADTGFVVSTGIECSAPVVAGGVRQDELRLTGHWDRYAEDAALVASFGIRHLRYGIPFHVVAADPARLDWDWTDRALDALREAGVEPIADLLHFGLPDDLWGFGDPRLPGRYLAFVDAFLARYPWIRRFTPVNEPFISSHFSAGLGWWNERRTGDRAFVAALANAAECAVDGMALIRTRVADPVFLQSDVCETFAPATGHEAALERADFLNERRFVGFDLAYGRMPAPVVQDWLLANGLDEARLDRLIRDGSAEGCIAGMDYYAGNEHVVAVDGTVTDLGRGERRGFAAVAREYHDHLGVPFMLAETNRVTDEAVEWMAETWNDALALRAEGRPIRGYCWYSLTDQVDWDTCLRVPAGHVDSLGLVDLDRRIRPAGELYRRLALAARAGVLAPVGAPEDEVAA